MLIRLTDLRVEHHVHVIPLDVLGCVVRELPHSPIEGLECDANCMWPSDLASLEILKFTFFVAAIASFEIAVLEVLLPDVRSV